MGYMVSICDYPLESVESIHPVLPLVRRAGGEDHREGEIKQFLIIWPQDMGAHPALCFLHMTTLGFLINFNP